MLTIFEWFVANGSDLIKEIELNTHNLLYISIFIITSSVSDWSFELISKGTFSDLLKFDARFIIEEGKSIHKSFQSTTEWVSFYL